jgi:arylesterase/paraoxonase
MAKKLTFAIIITLLIGLLIRVLIHSGTFKNIKPQFQGTVLQSWKAPYGPEDLDMVYSKNHLIFSATDRRKGGSDQDGLYFVDLNKSNPTPEKIKDNYPGQMHPHGIFVLEEDSTTFVFVVNHQEPRDYIDKFVYDEGRLELISSYTDELIQGANDVAAITSNVFYATRDHGFKKGWKRTLEDYLILPLAKVVRFKEGKFSVVADGFQYANGINYSPDGSTLYVAETTGRRLNVFDIDEKHNLHLVQKIPTYTGVDNIDVDKKGKLWIGCHPKLLAFVAHAKDINNLSPSQVLKIDPENNYSIEEIVMDDGTAFSGCSTALMHEDVLYTGVVFDPIIWRGKLK